MKYRLIFDREEKEEEKKEFPDKIPEKLKQVFKLLLTRVSVSVYKRFR